MATWDCCISMAERSRKYSSIEIGAGGYCAGRHLGVTMLYWTSNFRKQGRRRSPLQYLKQVTRNRGWQLYRLEKNGLQQFHMESCQSIKFWRVQMRKVMSKRMLHSYNSQRREYNNLFLFFRHLYQKFSRLRSLFQFGQKKPSNDTVVYGLDAYIFPTLPFSG